MYLYFVLLFQRQKAEHIQNECCRHLEYSIVAHEDEIHSSDRAYALIAGVIGVKLLFFMTGKLLTKIANASFNYHHLL